MMMWVIIMKTYLVYHIKEHTKELLQCYPSLEKEFYHLKPINPFFSSQIETLFYSNKGVNKQIKEYFKGRSDYKNQSNVHTLYNQITKESIICTVYDYYIEIKANNKKNIFFDILYQNSKNYVIIDEQCK